MNAPKQAVVLCGGRGERLKPLTDHIPKPLAPVLGRPFLDYTIEQLRGEGFEQVLLLTGYRGDQVADRYRNVPWVICIQTDPDWETGVRLAHARQSLTDRFLLLYCDNLAPLRLGPLLAIHRRTGAAVTVTVAHKEKGNIALSGSLVDRYDSSRQGRGLEWVEIGYMIVNRDDVLKLDLSGSFSVVLRELAGQHRLAAYDPGCSYLSISDLDRLRHAEEFMRPKRILLLDRDGIINRKAPRGEYIWTRDKFEWIPETVEALGILAAHGFEFVVISNQAGIARGVYSRQDADALYGWMRDELALKGVRVIDAFICEHHWDEKCACRKPAPGMFWQVSNKYNLCLNSTFYVGDDPRDIEAAWNASCRSIFIAPQEEPDVPHQDWRAADLRQLVDPLISFFEELE